MIVHRSNRTEALVDALAALVAVPPADPFAAEVIVVQGRGMARWLGLELAGRLGIWANPDFPFPRAFIEQMAKAILGEPAAGAAAFTPEGLTWAIAAELPRQLGAPRFAPVQRFLRADQHGSRLLPLAGRIADLFDQYAVFRPEMVLTWEEGGGDPDDWQPALWRALVGRLGALHPAARARDLLAAVRAGATPAAALPPRVSVFGLATLPPVYVDVLAALADRIELHLFALSPSRAYWGDLPSARERRRALAAGGDDAELHLEAPPLLASLGRVGRDFQAVLESRLSYQDDPLDRYAEPGEGSLLAALQSDILDLRLRGAGGAPPITLAADDTSLAIHACHGPMRELEVLHDQLTTRFAADPTLRPHDVIVMTPSIDTYAPLVEAVFTSPDRPRIPYTIADRRARVTRDVVDAFLRALDLLSGRLPASAVLDLLALDAVRQRFAIPAEGLDTIRGWIEAAGVRWGADAAHRAAEGVPPCGDHTWRFGLDRLLLGTALPSDDASLWREVLPSGDLEGSEADLLGQLVAFVETLMHFRRRLATPHPPAAWRDRLGELLAAIAHQKPGYADQHDTVLVALALLAERAALGGFEQPLGLPAVRRLLETALAVEPAPLGFLTGAVTICEMVPMRTVPFRVVALVGLSDGVFPRAPRPLAFDLMARQPRPGDRTARDDDRYLFLEALLSARERLLVTYVGHSITNNAELPPSVVVSELLDAIDATAQLPGDGGPAAKARTAIVHHHPLQPFSPEAFRGGPQASWARSQFAGARALCAPRRPTRPFIAAPLPAAPVTALTLDDLIEFFKHPIRWFLRQELQLSLASDEEAPDDREPIELSPLERWEVGDRLLHGLLAGVDAAATVPLLRAGGLLPHGTLGHTQVERELATAAEVQAAAVAGGIGALLDPCEVQRTIGNTALSGMLRCSAAGGLARVQFSRVEGGSELELWIRHLVLNATIAPTASSLLIGRAKSGSKYKVAVVRFAPVSDPARHLGTLVDLFQRGQSLPLPLLKSASRAYAAAWRGKLPTFAKARSEARRKFEDNDRIPGDGADPYVAQVYPELPQELREDGTADETAEIFRVARAVFDPLLDHREGQ